ncbi:MAG: glycosyltransferase family 2 protein [bacterium]|nr:glycosyltransferase family 2 protein [bacterium]
MRPCLLIPNYDHGSTMKDLLASLENLGLECIVVDDGSGAATQQILRALDERYSWVRVVMLPENRGKGEALRTGYRLAHSLGFTHAVQLDADGQHDAIDVPLFLEIAEQRPDALLLGMPSFENASRVRLYGRLLSCFWVWIETLSFEIRDPLCGLRSMPLGPTLGVLERTPCGDRMDFDPEIAVRLFWASVPVVNVPCRVRYFADGLSHFDFLWDNVRMTRLHVRLFFGMVTRLPWLLRRRSRN